MGGAFPSRVTLGRSGLLVSKIGLGSSYAAPTASYLEAFDRGLNYFYWGSRRRDFMGDAIREIARSRREDLVLVIQSYARAGFLVRHSLERALRTLGTDYADVLLLGWHNSRPSNGILSSARRLVDEGRVRHVALSSHNRKLLPELIDQKLVDIWHLRYNAVHRGAEHEVFAPVERRATEARPGIVTYTTTRWGHLCDPSRTPRGERTPNGTDCHRFVLSHPAVDMSICGPSNSAHVHDALRALELGPMTEEELAWMRRVGDHIYGKDPTTGVRDSV